MSRPTVAQGFSVGFVLFVATILLVAGVFLVGAGGGIFHSQAEYHFLCPSTSGLKTGAKVYLSGVAVGNVTDIDFVEDLEVSDVRVTVAVMDSVAARIRADSYVALQSEGLLGDNSVYISVGTTERPPVEEGAQIPFRESSLLDAVVGQETTKSATELMSELVDILRTVKKGEGSIGKLLVEPELYENLAKFTDSLDKLALTLDGVATDMDGIITEVKDQRGALGKLIFSKEYEANIARTVEESSKLIAALERIVAATENKRSLVMRLLTDEELGERVASIVERVDRGSASLEVVLAKLERGEGSLGALVHDPSIVRSLQDVFLGVQELGYVRNVIQHAERLGRRASSQETRASEVARIEAARAKFLASIQAAGSEVGKPVPAVSKDDDKPKQEGDDEEKPKREDGKEPE